jgi:hypothetical protein
MESLFGHLLEPPPDPATELRLPGPDGQSPDVKFSRRIEGSPRYGLEVVGPPIPDPRSPIPDPRSPSQPAGPRVLTGEGTDG